MGPVPATPPELNVHARITTHEAICAERYGALQNTINFLNARIGKLEALVWVVAGSLIVGMSTLIVTMIFRFPVR